MLTLRRCVTASCGILLEGPRPGAEPGIRVVVLDDELDTWHVPHLAGPMTDTALRVGVAVLVAPEGDFARADPDAFAVHALDIPLTRQDHDPLGRLVGMPAGA